MPRGRKKKEVVKKEKTRSESKAPVLKTASHSTFDEKDTTVRGVNEGKRPKFGKMAFDE